MKYNTQKKHIKQKNLQEDLKNQWSQLEKESADIIRAAAGFGQIETIEDIEKLEACDKEDLIAVSHLLELKTKARELIEKKQNLENVICLEPSKLHETVDAAERLLIKYSESQSLYQRSGRLVRVAEISSFPQEKQKTIIRPHNAVVIREIDQAFATVLLTKLGTFVRQDGRTGKIVNIDCPEKISRYLLSKQEWGLPILTGIINTPTLRPDGSILDVPGYDKISGMLFIPGDCVFEKIPENPSQDDINQSVKYLLDVLKDFAFENEASKSVALAAILTVLIRKSVATAPLFGFTAPKMGSGKSLLADVVALIGTGKPNSVISQAESEAEEKKRHMAVLIEGDPIVCYDNIERPFGSPSLCAVLTQREYKDRILGVTETRTVLTNTTFLATGNNLIFMGDISTRALLCRLDPQVERPEERSFDINLHQYIPIHRAQLVKAGLIILRAYYVAGKPKQTIKQFGRFEEWSDWIRSALVWLEMADPCETRKDIESSDPIREVLGELFPSWYANFNDTPTKIKDVVSKALGDENGELYNALKELASDRKGGINQRSLAKKLASFKGRIENGYRLEQMPRNQGTSLWRIKKIDL